MANEKRLIDANALKRWTCEWCNKTRPEEPCEPSDCAIMLFYDGQPTVDAVEVVRCEFCEHWDKGYRFCKRHGLDYYGNSSFGENGFCSYGERRTE